MRPGWKSLLGVTLVAPGLLILTLAQRRTVGDEPSRLGRLFRFGSSASSSPSSSPTTPAAPYSTVPEVSPSPSPAPGSTVTPRIIPRPRVTRPITESDPIILRITLNHSDDGNTFGMFLQVFADGTVIDSEGVHHVGQDALKPLIEALQAGELYRLKGHCGAPATDYLESVHVTVYERSLGRLRANVFSYSGNPQGCDNAVRHLHATLDNLQSRITRPMPVGAPTPSGMPWPTPMPMTAPSPSPSQTVIPLSPL